MSHHQVGDPAPFENRDGVDDRFDPVCACADRHACASRAELRDRPQGGATAEQRGQECEKGGRRPGWAAPFLELEAPVLRGQVQLPEADPVLDTPAQRDPGIEEPMPGGVEVRGGEGPRRERLAADVGQGEARVHVQR